MKGVVANVEITTGMMNKTNGEINTPKWKLIYKTAAVAALLMAFIVPVQIVVFLSFPPPTTVEGFFSLLNKNVIVGLVEYDFLIVVDMALMIFIYLALYVTLKRKGEAAATIGLALGLIGIAAYFASNTSMEMLSLSNQYAAATTGETKTILLAAGQAVFEIYRGTAFAIYYVLSAVALLLFTYVMFNSNIFSKANAYFGLLSGVLMLVPPIPVFGKIAITLSLLSLVPWTVWLILFAKKLLKIRSQKGT
jgi:hypothetical protein